MKRLLLLSVLFIVLYSCKQSSSPKETAQQFVKAIYTADISTASSLATSDTKTMVDKVNPLTKNTLPPEESFQFATLTETSSGNTAEVKNDIVAIDLVKENDNWKVKANESLLSAITGRDTLLATVKTKWEALLKEYEGRLQAIREYIDYKKSAGALSPKAQALSDAANNFPTYKEWTKDKILDYVQKQQQLAKVIDDALEPSMAANTDLSVTYFLQISNATDRIKSAQVVYEPYAEQAHSPVFVPLPIKPDTNRSNVKAK